MKALLSSGQIVAINGMQMYYVAHGQGEPLVLLHGYTGSSGDWEAFLPYLANEYQLIIPDLRGHGRSTNPSTTFTFRQAALDVFALLEHLGIDQFKAIGMSGGGNTLLHMATQQPGRVAAMALATITARTLIVSGDRDPFVPVHIAIEMVNAIPHSYICIVPNGGHVPVFYDLCEPFIKTVLTFLRGDWE